MGRRPDLDAFGEFLEARSNTLAEYDMNVYDQPSAAVEKDREEWLARQLARARRNMGVGPRQHPTAMCQQRDDEVALSRRRLANSPRECSCLDHPAGHLATGRSAADQVLVATRSR